MAPGRRRNRPQRRQRGTLGSRHGRKELLSGLLRGEATMLQIADVLRESGMPRQKIAGELRWIRRRNAGIIEIANRALEESGASGQQLLGFRASLASNVAAFGKKIASGGDASKEARRIASAANISTRALGRAIENLQALKRYADADSRELADAAIRLCWREIGKLGRMAKTFSGLAGKKGLWGRGQ